MDDFLQYFDTGTPLGVALTVVAGLIGVVCVISLGVSVWLSIRYVRYNKQPNSAGLTGEETARAILDRNGLQHIAVKTVGSLLFGNSYSHYFKKVRLRRRTKNKTSLAALAMGAQKSALAVLDKEGDPDMKRRVRLIPLMTFGPFAFIPLVVVGAVADVLLFSGKGDIFIYAAVLGAAFYLFSLILSVTTLRTEKKAQERCYSLLRQNGMATEEELSQLRELFRLYNIQYINDIVLSALELLYRILQIAAEVSSHSAPDTP